MADQKHIVFAHENDSWYLPYVLHQAAGAIPGACVTLIGDQRAERAVRGYPRLRRQIEYVPADSLQSSEEREFVSSYRHLSTNSHRFELACWLRWFWLRKWMESTGVRSVAYLDSDVLIYPNAARRLFPQGADQGGCSYLIPAQDYQSFIWSASGHTSRWSATALQRFCEFSLHSFGDNTRLALYLEKHAWHKRTGAAGGICDMTTLYLYYLENRSSIDNLAVPENGSMFDMGISSSSNYEQNEYRVVNGVKSTVRTESGLKAFRMGSSEPLVEVLSLHFQGSSKSLIPDYCWQPLPKMSPRHFITSELGRILGRLKRATVNAARPGTV